MRLPWKEISRPEWGNDTFIGQVEVESDWNPGPEKMTIIRFPQK
jgi:hypothetical protein